MMEKSFLYSSCLQGINKIKCGFHYFIWIGVKQRFVFTIGVNSCRILPFFWHLVCRKKCSFLTPRILPQISDYSTLTLPLLLLPLSWSVYGFCAAGNLILLPLLFSFCPLICLNQTSSWMLRLLAFLGEPILNVFFFFLNLSIRCIALLVNMLF